MEIQVQVRLHRSIVIIGGLVLALMPAACQSNTDVASQSAESVPTLTDKGSPAAIASASSGNTTGVGGEETSVFDLEVGDCFSASGDPVATVTVIDCEDAHIYEVFAVFDHEADDAQAYPGDDAILEYADSRCQPLFEDYVRTDYQTSIYWITSVTPSEETWDNGDDREIVCTLKLGEAGDETTGSAEGTGE